MAFRSSSSRSDAGVITLAVAAACLGACATGVEGMTDSAGSGAQDANITLRDGGADAAPGSSDAGGKDASSGTDASGPAIDGSAGAPDADVVDAADPGEPETGVDADMPASDGGGPVEQDAATTPDASDAASELDTGRPDAAPPPPVSCDALVRTGVQLCDKTADTCGVVFTNRAGCTATCAAGGLVCGTAYENVEQQCARDETRPAIACDSGHESDYCLCRRP